MLRWFYVDLASWRCKDKLVNTELQCVHICSLNNCIWYSVWHAWCMNVLYHYCDHVSVYSKAMNSHTFRAGGLSQVVPLWILFVYMQITILYFRIRLHTCTYKTSQSDHIYRYTYMSVYTNICRCAHNTSGTHVLHCALRFSYLFVRPLRKVSAWKRFDLKT